MGTTESDEERDIVLSNTLFIVCMWGSFVVSMFVLKGTFHPVFLIFSTLLFCMGLTEGILWAAHPAQDQ